MQAQRVGSSRDGLDETITCQMLELLGCMHAFFPVLLVS